MRYRRVVAKFGTSLLTAGSDRLDIEAMSRLAAQVVRLRAEGVRVVCVSSGARAAGRNEVGKRLSGGHQPGRQALASIGQHRLMATWGMIFDAYDTVVAQVLLTRRDLSDRLGYLNARNTLRDLLDSNTVPIVNENDAVALDRMLATTIGENDSLSAYVANLIDADLLAILTDVEGLYDADPHVVPDAKLLRRIERIDDAVESMAGAARGPGTGGMATKLSAARVATQGGVEVVIFNGRRPDALFEVCEGAEAGTRFPAPVGRLESRKRWILGSVSRAGFITIDQGAALALRSHGRSLLPAGVAGVGGSFERGESVEVRDPDGARVAAGTANYGSEELDRIRGLKSSQIGDVLGYAFGDEVIHRDNLILL